MMNQVGGWMSGGTGGTEWIWVVIGTLVAVLLVVTIVKLVSAKS